MRSPSHCPLSPSQYQLKHTHTPLLQLIEPQLPAQLVNFWETLFWGGNDVANDFSSRGFQIILSNPDYMYVDFPNEFNPKERGYYWGSRAQTIGRIFGFAPENLPQNAETSTGRDGVAFSSESKAPTKPNVCESTNM